MRRTRHVAAVAPWAIAAAAGLAPSLWFIRGVPIKGVDSYFSLHPSGRLDASLSAWDSRTSTGVPASDIVAAGFNWLQGALSFAGLPLVAVEAVIVLCLSIAAALGMYLFGMEIFKRHVALIEARWISCAVSVTWLANPFALSFVWAHQLFIEVTWAVLPWILIILFRAGSRRLHIVDAACLMLFTTIIGSAAFVHSYLPGLALLLTAFGIVSVVSSRITAQTLVIHSVLALSLVAGIAWWLLPSLTILGSLLAQATVGSDAPPAQLAFASQFSNLQNVISLTAVPILHLTVGKTPYLAWSWVALTPPGSIFVFVLPAVAAIGAIYAFVRASSRAIATALTASALIGAFVSKGLNPPYPEFNLALLSVPLGDAFRHPLDKLSFDVVFPLCMLFGFGLMLLAGRRSSRPLAGLAAFIVCGYLATPWWVGSVVPVGGGRLPSAFVDVPSSYTRVGNDLSTLPQLGKTMVLPYSIDGGTAFNWSSGIQPNLDCLLQDWAPRRSVMCHDTGIAAADRVPEAIQQAVTNFDPRAFDLAYQSGIDSWLVHRDWASAYIPPAVSPPVAMTFLTHPLSPLQPMLRIGQPMSFSQDGQGVSFFLRVNATLADSEDVLRLGSVTLQANRASLPGEAYLGLSDRTRHLWYPADGDVFQIGTWRAVTIQLRSGRLYLSIDGADQGELSSCGPSACRPISGHGIPVVGDTREIVIIRSQTAASVDISQPNTNAGAAHDGIASSYAQVVTSSPQLTLFRQASLPVIYAAQSVVPLVSDSPGDLLAAAEAGVRAPNSVMLPTYDAGTSVDHASNTTWIDDSATHIHGRLTTQGPNALLVFLQTYDSEWKLTINNSAAPPPRHLMVNGFANGWLVSASGALNWTLNYGPQDAVTDGFYVGCMTLVLSLGLPIARLAWRRLGVRRSRIRRPIN